MCLNICLWNNNIINMKNLLCLYINEYNTVFIISTVLILIVHSVLTKLNISMIETPKRKNIHEYSFIDNYFYDNYIDINKSNKKKYLFIFQNN